MANVGKILRRTFLFGAVAVAGGAAFGAWHLTRPLPNPLRPEDGETALNPFVLIDAQGVSLIAPRAEMGQGVATTWAALLAEELDVALEDVRVLHGPAGVAYFNTALLSEALPGKGYDTSDFKHNFGELLGQLGRLFEMQVTGGSTSMKDGYERMRAIGAATRERLKIAAAARFGREGGALQTGALDARDLRTEAGMVIAPDGRSLPYTDLAAEAADVPVTEVDLRPRSEWRLLGRALPRVDMVEKATGTATFGIDVRLPGMKFAAVRRSPTRGAMTRFDPREALRLPYVEKVVELTDGYAVVSSNSWLAMQALDVVEAEWGPAPYPESTDAMMQVVQDGFDTEVNSTLRDDGDVTDLPAGATVLEADYSVPFLAHATMEPMNATAWINSGGLDIWCGNQAPTFIRRSCAEIAGLEKEDVRVHTTYLGGGFGRRGELDFAQVATQVAMAVPGSPVQVVWSREEDMTHDFYRPAAMARMRGAVAQGTAVMLDGAVSGPSVSAQAMNRWMGTSPSGPDKGHVDGMFNQPYGIESFRVRGYLAQLEVPIGFWRSVGASHNAFFMESFVDEMAHAAGADPLDFRMALTRDEHAPSYECLRAVRDMSGWTGQTPEGVGRGVALCYSFGTPVAQVVEVVQEDAGIRIARAWITCDPGVALDPGILEAQMTGGMIFGLSAAVGQEITFEGGVAQQRNFPDFDSLRIHTAPACSVRILETNPRLGGAGEPGTPPAAPALANALFDLTGKRARSLPLNREFDFVL